MYHSLKKFLKYRISLAALFLACKTEDVYVKSEYFIYLYFKFVSPNDIKVNSEVSKRKKKFEKKCIQFH